MSAKKILKNVDFWIMALPILFGFFLPELIKKNTSFLWTWQFFFPLTMMASYFLTAYFCQKEPGKNQTILEKLLALLPILLIAIEVTLLFPMLYLPLSTFRLINAICGFVFLWIGNLLPKIEQNQTLGIRTPWTLQNRDNWNYTHRVCGKVWMVCGALLLFFQFVSKEKISLIASIFLLVAICITPIWISWYKAQSQKREKIWTSTPYPSSKWKTIALLVVLFGVGMVVVLVFVLGKFSVDLQSDRLVIQATFEHGITLPLEEIEDMKLIFTPNGNRLVGYQTPSLQMGEFYSDELGSYRTYIWTSSPLSIEVDYDGQILVFNQEDEKKTEQLYDQIVAQKEETNFQ